MGLQELTQAEADGSLAWTLGFAGLERGNVADFPLFLEWVREGKFPLGKLVTNRYSLEQIEEARVALEEALPNCLVFGLGESEPE